MPQATPELRQRWHCDACALKALQLAFGPSPRFYLTRGGVIKPRVGVEPTPDELNAIDYLCQEWDYGYEPK